MNTENQQTEQAIPAEKKELEITKEIGGYLHQAGKWSKFLAIVGFVLMGLMIFAGFIMGIVMSFIPSESMSMMPFPPFLIGVVYLIISAIYFFPILYLYRFSTNIRQALFTNNQNQLTKAFNNLRAHYRFIAILMIVMFCLYIVMFVVMIFAGLFAGFSGLPSMHA